ncbi:MAG: LptE family protein [Chitinophagales bacterium]
MNRFRMFYSFGGLRGILLALICLAGHSCSVYSFKDVSIPPQVKTIRIGFIENRARIVDPQLSPQLTDKLKQKVNNQTKLTQVQSDDADYDVLAYISDYSVSTSGVSNQAAVTNRLTVTVHIALKNRLNDQKLGTPDFETDISRNFDFPGTQSVNDAQAALTPQIVSDMTDDIFNRLFSNW